MSAFEWASGSFVGPIPAFDVVTLAAGYRVAECWRIQVLVENLLDERHYEAFGGDELVAARSTETSKLRGLISSSVGTPLNGGARPGGAIQLPRPSGRRPLSVLVAPLPRLAFDLYICSPVVALFVSDPEEKAESTESLLSRLFELTRAEARVAARVIQGKDLREVAHELGVSYNTVRTQVGAILAKTGASRQSDLVRILLRSPAGLLGVAEDA